MVQGTTPTYKFSFPFPASDLLALEITFSQCDNIVLQKGLADCTREDNVATITLTQAETYLFEDGCACLQLRYKERTNVWATATLPLKVHKALSKEILNNGN